MSGPGLEVSVPLDFPEAARDALRTAETDAQVLLTTLHAFSLAAILRPGVHRCPAWGGGRYYPGVDGVILNLRVCHLKTESNPITFLLGA